MRRFLHFLTLPIFTASLISAAGVAPAQEAIIYDRDDCTGDYRMLYDDVSDLRDMDFDNEANSYRVTSGSWSFYRDADYREENGPKITVTGFSLNANCRNFEDAAETRGFSFPHNRLSAAELISPVSATIMPPGPVAILYDRTNFRGDYRVLTRMVPDFDDIDFDNDAESVRVIRGTWIFYRNEDYGQTGSRPSVMLEPGDYPDIENLPGYAEDYFPQDRMSSAQPIEN